MPPPSDLFFSCARWLGVEQNQLLLLLLLLLLLPDGMASFQQEYIVERPCWGGPGGPGGLAGLGLALGPSSLAWLGLAWHGLAWLGLAWLHKKIFSALRAKV